MEQSGFEQTRGSGEPDFEKLIAAATDRVRAVLRAAEQAAGGILADAEKEAQRRIEESRQRADDLIEESRQRADELVEESRRRTDGLMLERIRLMAELTDDLLEQAVNVKRQSEVLIETLDSAIRELELDSGRGRARPSAVREPVAPPPAPEPEPVGGTASPDRPPEVSGVRPAPGEAGPRREALEELRARIARSGQLSPVEPTPEPVPEPGPEPPPLRDVSRSRPDVQRAAVPSEGARLLATQMAVAGSSRDEIERRLREEFGIDDAGAILDSVGGTTSR